MKISLNSVKAFNLRYKTADDVAAAGIDAVVEKIGSQLGEVEGVERFGDKYKGVVITKIVKCEDHPNADRLHVCTIDDGGITPDVKRDDDGNVQVVCGAPNVREGLMVAWLPPGSTVPASVGKEPFILEARELRGVVSNGMLASAKELSLGDDHDGILEVDDQFNNVQVGQSFGDVFGLIDDAIIDIENKMFTHRPDCFGFLGVNRELAGIQGVPFKSPDWYTLTAQLPAVETDGLPLEVRNELPGLVPRFTAITMRDVKVGPSPTWLVVELAKVGQRSINNIVDYTNFFMLQTGQPLHAYDYDKLKTLDGADKATIVVRPPHQNEELTLLNGKTIKPRPEAIMIASDSKLIGLGGVMGGGETEVDETTQNIVLECATFDMYSVRRTSMVHGLFTDAVTRFNKGQSPLQNTAVLARVVDEIRQFAGGKVASELVDVNQAPGREWVHPPVPVTAEFINARLGFELSADDMKALLENVEFRVAIEGEKLTVTAPFWRTDIETREDVVEEVGRLYGFDKLPQQLPMRSVKPVQKDRLLGLKTRIRNNLSRAGANEVLTYSFVHSDLFQKVGQDQAHAFQISNALSPDLQYYRLSLLPSLLDKVHTNLKAGYDEFALFELGKAHLVDRTDDQNLPREDDLTAVVIVAADKLKKTGAAYYAAQKYLTNLVTTELTFKPVPTEMQVYDITKPFDMKRSAFVYAGEVFLGIVGEFRTAVRRSLKLPTYCAGFELDTQALLQVLGEDPGYLPILKFPSVFQDMTLKVASSQAFDELRRTVNAALGSNAPDDTHIQLDDVGIYQSADDTDHKNITFRATITGLNRTLTDKEVSKVVDAIADEVKTKLGAEKI